MKIIKNLISNCTKHHEIGWSDLGETFFFKIDGDDIIIHHSWENLHCREFICSQNDNADLKPVILKLLAVSEELGMSENNSNIKELYKHLAENTIIDYTKNQSKKRKESI